jgi:hypothetical protein
MRTLSGIAAIACLCLPALAVADLRTYDVDPKYRQEVYQALVGVLQSSPNPTGRVERLPTGQLLIEAAPDVHKQIAAVLDAVAARQAIAAPQVTLRYWAVLGRPGAGDEAGAPAILRDVFDEIEGVHGPLGFQILGNAALVTESGQRGEFKGYPLSIRQQTFAQGTALNVQIRIEFAYRRLVHPGGNGNSPSQPQWQEIELKTTLDAGDTVVLGENTIDTGELKGTMFYIIYWAGAQ